ncbi:MAG: methionyl-tRNA formyltransferase [Bacteroidia bacterium]
MRIVFMGTPDFAIPTLRVLVDHGYDVVAVVTSPDKPSGRGLQLSASPVKEFAVSRGLHVLQPEKLRDPAFLEELRSLQPDLAVVVAFRMLPEVVWSLPKHGTLNLHAALLPDYRGAAPLNWALINGETKTGATTFFIDQQIDTGGILLKTEIDIPHEWTAGDLHDAMMERGATLVLDTVKAIDAGTVKAQPQDEKEFLHPAPKIFKEDCRIDWSRPAREVYNFVRGLSPYPTAWTTLGGKVLKIFKVSEGGQEIDGNPGTLLRNAQGELWVRCGDGCLRIDSLQLEGKKRMETAAFLLGHREELSHVE